MTATQGSLGLNTQVAIGNGASPEVYTLIPDVYTPVDGPELTPQFVDFTHMQSTGGVEESKASFKSPGNVTFGVHYVKDNAQHELLVTNALANPVTETAFKITYPDGSIVYFQGYPSVKFNADPKGKFTMAVTVKLSGVWEMS